MGREEIVPEGDSEQEEGVVVDCKSYYNAIPRPYRIYIYTSNV